MTPIGTVRYGGRAKWAEVFLNLLLALLAVGFAAVVLTQVPPDAYPIHALAWYTLWGALVCAGLAVAHAVTRQMPTVERRVVQGSPASGVRAWRGERMFEVGTDLGLGVVALAITVMGLVAGGEWVVPSLLLGVGGAWFVVRAALSTIGPRRDEALWLTDEHLVHYSKRGREQCARSQIVLVRAMNDDVMVMVNGPIERRLVPFLWRPRGTSTRLKQEQIWFPTRHVGHTADQLATWLSAELGLDERGLAPLKP
jgi:hypothetical protein